MTDNEIMKALRSPFPKEDIEWRVQSSWMSGPQPKALVLAYITNRAIMERLDSIFGVFGWTNEFKEGPGGGVLCGISVLYNEQWIVKWDGADNTNIEKVKGGLSGAMKRAATQWGIGRYLYGLKSDFAKISANGTHRDMEKKTNTRFKWDPPPLPAWALPPTNKSTKPPPPPSAKPAAQQAQDDATVDGFIDQPSSELCNLITTMHDVANMADFRKWWTQAGAEAYKKLNKADQTRLVAEKETIKHKFGG